MAISLSVDFETVMSHASMISPPKGRYKALKAAGGTHNAIMIRIYLRICSLTYSIEKQLSTGEGNKIFDERK